MLSLLPRQIARWRFRSKPKALAGKLVRICLPLTVDLLLLVISSFAVEPAKKLLEFRGSVTLPAGALSRGRRLSISLFGVDTPYTGHAWSDFQGRFRFPDLAPGSYTLSIYIPNNGEIVETVDITKSFSDSKGRMERKFEFNEERLRLLLRPVSQDVVSVRVLGISGKARGEYEKAQLRLQRQDVDGAIQHLEKAVALSPRFAEALNNLGTIYFQRREYAKAEHSFRQALELDPQAYVPLVNLGGTLLAMGRAKEALAINLRAQKARPNDALANAQLAFSYLFLHDDENALTYLRLTKELDPAHFTHPEISLAKIYMHRSERAAALRELKDFLEYHPDSSQAPDVRAAIERLQNGQQPGPASPNSKPPS